MQNLPKQHKKWKINSETEEQQLSGKPSVKTRVMQSGKNSVD